jgi:hypothetical protein
MKAARVLWLAAVLLEYKIAADEVLAASKVTICR